MVNLAGRLGCALGFLPLLVSLSCATHRVPDSDIPEEFDNRCRVRIETWKGTAVAIVDEQRSDVKRATGSSTALLEGSNIVIKGWMGDSTVGRVESDQFVIVAGQKEFPSEPIVNGKTAFTAEGLFGSHTQPILSENCTNEQVALGGAHLIVLASQSHLQLPRK